MRWTKRLAGGILLHCALLNAESRWTKAWKWSAAALVAGHTVDVSTSYRAYESNPLLRGHDGRLALRGVLLKMGVVGGVVVVQGIAAKKQPKWAKPFAVINMVQAGVVTKVVVGNLNVPRK